MSPDCSWATAGTAAIASTRATVQILWLSSLMTHPLGGIRDGGSRDPRRLAWKPQWRLEKDSAPSISESGAVPEGWPRCDAASWLAACAARRDRECVTAG